MKNRFIALALTSLLASCGGGGSDDHLGSRGATPTSSPTATSSPGNTAPAGSPGTAPGTVNQITNNTTNTTITGDNNNVKVSNNTDQDQNITAHLPPPVIAPPQQAPKSPEPAPSTNTTTTQSQTPTSPTVVNVNVDNTNNNTNTSNSSSSSSSSSTAVTTSPGQNASDKAAQFLLNITSPTPPSARSMKDNPDDYTDAQVHVVYAVPKGEADRGFDVTTKFTNSITVWNNWLGAESGGRKVKFDTYQGKLDITYVALPRTDREYSSLGVTGRIQQATADLDAALGGLKSNKKYMVYFEGGRQYEYAYVACGDTTLGHNVVFQYLLADPKNMGTCFTNRDFAATTFVEPRYLDYIMIHEFVHAEGGVGPQAPDFINYHTNDGENDLMAYSGNFDGWKTLDIGKNDYFNPNGLPSGAYNFATSAFLTK